jgi:hypothetical protein
MAPDPTFSPPAGRGFRRTLLRVLIVQLVALVLLLLLQLRYDA